MTMKAPILSFQILNYKTKEQTLSCLRSIVQYYREELERKDFEILVFDNGSDDGSYAFLKKQEKTIPQLSVFESSKNLGFAKGQNFLAKKAQGEFLFFLNSDALVLDTDILKMVNYLQNHSDVGIVGSKIIGTNNQIERSTGSFYTPFNLFLVMVGLERFGFVRKHPKNIDCVDWVSGGAMMIKKELFERLKGFDEQYFMYFEDMDLCYRAQKAGYKVVYFPQSCIQHSQHGSSSREYAILNIYKGILHFYKKHRSYSEYLFARNLLVLKALLLSFMGHSVYKKVNI